MMHPVGALWVVYLSLGRAALQGLGTPSTAHPAFADGCAIADLITGHTLVDIKASDALEPDLSSWLRQIISYALLATAEHRSVEAVGVYHAAEGLLLTWPLQDLLERITGSSADRSALAMRLSAAVTSERQAVESRRR